MNKTKNLDENKILVLTDNRVGGAHQAISLAEVLQVPYAVEKIEYNCLAKLPNTLLALYPIHVKQNIVRRLRRQTMPKIIISAGRRAAALAVYLKKHTKHPIKIIQIMRPCLDSKEFEYIILPQHDKLNPPSPNLIRVIGALSNMYNILPKATENFYTAYPDMKDFIAVIIGGKSKDFDFNLQNAQELANYISTLSTAHSIPLFISFSRRTPKNIKALFKRQFTFPNMIYDTNDSTPNPYPGIIGAAKYIILTADSISMCSESASTGKPIYIYCPKNFALKKHRFFVQQLVDLSVARLLNSNVAYLENYRYEPLIEVERIGVMLRKEILSSEDNNANLV